MNEWQKCPVCEGKGLVPNGFYTAIGIYGYPSTSATPETCRACDGKGLLLTPGYTLPEVCGTDMDWIDCKHEKTQ